MNPCLTNTTASTYKNNKQCSSSVLLWLLHQRHQWRKCSLIENSLNCCHTQLCTVISKAVLMKEEWKDNPSITFSGKTPHFYAHDAFKQEQEQHNPSLHVNQPPPSHFWSLSSLLHTHNKFSTHSYQMDECQAVCVYITFSVKVNHQHKCYSWHCALWQCLQWLLAW